jgi:hypothetical protein
MINAVLTEYAVFLSKVLQHFVDGRIHYVGPPGWQPHLTCTAEVNIYVVIQVILVGLSDPILN